MHQAATALLAGGAQKDVFYNSAAYLAPDKLVIIERISNPTAGMPGRLTLVVADFANATNLVGHPKLGEGTLDPEKPSPPGGAPTHDKLEGLAVINRTTVAIADDNDFGILNVNDRSRIWVLRLKAPMF